MRDRSSSGVGCSCGADTIPGSIHAEQCDSNEDQGGDLYARIAETDGPVEDDPTAQDVIDAMRFVTTAQKDPAELHKIFLTLLEWAPETDSNRGIELIMRLLLEASLKVTLTEPDEVLR